jgi:hypothetical protein
MAGKLWGALALAVIVAGVLVSACTPKETTPADPARNSPVAGLSLALISSQCSRVGTGALNECTGFVRNISDKPLKDVQVVIEWTDESGTPISSDDALIDYNPLLPGQESPWDVYGNYNPALTQYRVRFKEFFGGTIATKDERE